MADFVWPEDTGTGAAQGDDNDAANFATAYHAVGLKNYVVQGLGFTLNAGTPSLDISSGKAVVDDPSATATQSSETRNEGVSYVAEMDARTGISLTDSAVNHVFLQVDLSTDDTINIVVNTTNSAPSEPQVKLGTVDTSNDTTTELNRNIPVNLGNLSSKTFSELSNANVSSPSAGQTILYDATNSEFVNSSISAGNGLGSSGSDGSFTLDVATDGIGTDELDESANFDFSSAISFTGGIDGGGSAISVTDDFEFNGNNVAGLNLLQDQSDNTHLTINDGGNLGINRRMDMNGNDIVTNNSTFAIRQNANSKMFLSNQSASDIVLTTHNSTSSNTTRMTFKGGSDVADIDVQNANLDMNDNKITDVSNNTTGDSMTADPESSSEDGYIEIEIGGSTKQIPFYDS